MKRFYNQYYKAFIMIISMLILINALFCDEREDRDIYFIIKLYENQQTDLALKQIKTFELSYKNSVNMNKVSFIKANILLENKEYNQADSIYSSLLKSDIDLKLLADVLINISIIRYEFKDYTKASLFLNRAEQIAYDSLQKYRIELIRGKVQSKLFNPKQAVTHFEKALTFKLNEPEAIYELLNAYLSIREKEKAKQLILITIQSIKQIDLYSSAVNVYLDYLIDNDEYDDVIYLKNSFQTYNLKTTEDIDLRFAKVLYLNGDFAGAQRILSQGIKYQGFREYLSALILVKQGQIDKADSIFSFLASGNLSAQDYLPYDKDDITISSWLERIKILYDKRPDIALRELKTYINSLGEESPDPNVLFTYGSLLFKSKQYQEAAAVLIKLKLSSSANHLDENIQIMLGDIWFNARVLDSAKQSYNVYLNLFPKGRYRIHALYNIALIDFEKKDYVSSKSLLNAIMQTTDNAETIAKCTFMLAEIDFFEANYVSAIEKYSAINSSIISSYSINFRIAQSLYFMEDYQKANEFISDFLKNNSNAKDILILQGNISFNLKQYETALSIYKQALDYDLSDEEKKEIKSYLALTYYRLKQFKEASKLYLDLSKDKESPEAYLIMAAKASYHAQDSHQALVLFKQFVSENPNSPFVNNAMANIGSIYYNLGNYNLATDTWVRLLNRFKDNTFFTEDEQVIIALLFNGLQFCLKNKSNQSVLDKLNDSIDSFKSEYIRFEIQYLLLKIYFGEEMWSEILDLAENLKSEFPQRQNNEIRQFVAGSLSKLNRFTEADSIFREIYALEPTPDILTEWAELDLKAGQFEGAITKLDNALNLEKTPERLLKLVSTAYLYPSVKLDYYWNKWSVQINPIPDKARLVWLKWNYDNNNWTTAVSVSNELLYSTDYVVSANAQLYKSLSLYRLVSDDALLELYKTVYLFPDILEVSLEAKKHIVRLYIDLGQYADANKVYSEIRDSLSSTDRFALDELLSGKN
jgi:tetratricopeptide (TPR) repeat protein